MKTELIYSYFPLWLQNIACNYYSHKMTKLRFNEEFFSLLEWLRESQFWSKEKIEAYQEEHIEQIIRHAYNTSQTTFRRTHERTCCRKHWYRGQQQTG